MPDAGMRGSSDHDEGHLLLKISLLPTRSRLECGRQEMQAILGHLAEQLSSSFISSTAGIISSIKSEEPRNISIFDPPALDLKNLQKGGGDEEMKKNSSPDGWKIFQTPGGSEESNKPEPSAFARAGLSPGFKLFSGPMLHVFQPDSSPSPALKPEAELVAEEEKVTGDQMLLGDLLRNLVDFTRIFSARGEPARGFARVQGEPASMMDSPAFEEVNHLENTKPGVPRFTVKLPNIENLMELVPQLGKAPQSFPDKRKLFSVEDFFKYTEAEGKKLFDELDRDKDGQVTLEDMELAMKKRRLPQRYAREFLRRTKKHWLKKSFGWSEFLSLMEQKEPVMLRAFNSLSLSKSGTLQKGQVLSLLRNAGLPATEENAAAMMRFLDSDFNGSITYGQFRNFLVLVPPERLFDDPRLVWFEAATVCPISPPIQGPAGSVLKSALAGGLACALSTSLLHPLDTLKTRVQASTMTLPELVSNIPSIGVRGLYRGYAPAILGQFSSHGLRTGIFEASKLVLVRMVPNVSELQVQSLASFCSTFLGTAFRIPCEVLKQRLQAGLYNDVGEAIGGTLRSDGWRGFFRGTGATLCREVPFYVAGMMIYEEAKKVVQNVMKRELAPWEVIAIGGLSGGLAAVCTTPFDVMKTRMMTSPPGIPVSMTKVTVKIVSEEGVLALFKGAVPRFFWIAPLGAMNFAGYELAKRAMEKKDQEAAAAP